MKYLLMLSGVSVIALTSMTCHAPTEPPAGADTTSSNFTWTVDTIGASGSYLYDVSIVNDTLAYAVGLIMPSDSVGRSNTIYWNNAAVWNGTKWTPIQIPYYYNGQKIFTTITFMFGRNQNDIWFGFVHWDGSQYSQHSPGPWFNSQATKMWESSDGSQLYVLGYNGLIAYSPDHGSTWQQVQTGTTLPFQDIWGDGGQVLAIGSDEFGLGGKYLVQLNGNTATHLNDSIPTAVSLSGIWFKANQKYFLVGDGVLTKNSLSDRLWQYDFNRTAASYYSFAIRGAGLDNIVIAGGYGDISFFNGARWTEYKELYNPIDQLRSVSISGNTIVAAGIRTYSGIQYYGVAYVGRR
ncbi:MAG: hypothetical protein M1469_05395 [Bacteroidetes bacterium]|nr:hypothetical protein [Bacteroidota bacterium]